MKWDDVSWMLAPLISVFLGIAMFVFFAWPVLKEASILQNIIIISVCVLFAIGVRFAAEVQCYG
jgi:hypothetical protein